MTRRQRALLCGGAVLAAAALLAQPLVTTALDVERWQRVTHSDIRDPIWLDPRWSAAPYSHWQLRNCEWTSETRIVPATHERITERATELSGQPFWTLVTE